jgi:hypothetical protein
VITAGREWLVTVHVQTTRGIRTAIRLDDDLIEWFKSAVHAAGGGNYQSLIAAACHPGRTAQRGLSLAASSTENIDIAIN